MTANPAPLDIVGRVTPLGVRFWDDLSRHLISDGLVLSAYRTGRPERRYAMPLNHADTFTLQNIWSAVEFGAGDGPYWEHLPPAQSWTIDVTDQARRFLPFSFEAAVPQRWSFQSACQSPIEPEPGVPLFSSPARALAAPCAVIRADLCDAAGFDPRTGEYAPAAWALVEAWHDGRRLGRGLADEGGGLLLAFPYPIPPDPGSSSPPAFSGQSWLVELRAFYSPVRPTPNRPDLCTALTQMPVTLFQLLSPAAELAPISVSYGVETVLKTPGLTVLLVGS